MKEQPKKDNKNNNSNKSTKLSTISNGMTTPIPSNPSLDHD